MGNESYCGAQESAFLTSISGDPDSGPEPSRAPTKLTVNGGNAIYWNKSAKTEPESQVQYCL